MKYYTLNGNGKIKIDKLTTWINNSKWSWIIPVLCVIIGGIVEGM